MKCSKCNREMMPIECAAEKLNPSGKRTKQKMNRRQVHGHEDNTKWTKKPKQRV
jgi:hypothetical protein